MRCREKKQTTGNVNVQKSTGQNTTQKGGSRPVRKRSTPGNSTALRGLQSDGPLVTSFALGNRATLLCPRLPHPPPTQSLILNSVGCVVTEAPEDLKSAFRMVSGSTSAGGLDEAVEFTLRGSSPPFFTEGLSLSRLWRAKSKSLSVFPQIGREPTVSVMKAKC